MENRFWSGLLVCFLGVQGFAWCGGAGRWDPKVPFGDLLWTGGSIHLKYGADLNRPEGWSLEGRSLALSMDDLGFSKEETQSDPQLQKDLEARSDMLKIHQTLGLITCIPMVTTYILGLGLDDDGGGGGGGEGEGGNRDLHIALGITTAALYATTASFAIFAPKPKGVKASGNTEIHQILAFIHGAAMIATPILGLVAEKSDDQAEAHFIAATTLVASYVASMAVVTF